MLCSYHHKIKFKNIYYQPAILQFWLCVYNIHTHIFKKPTSIFCHMAFPTTLPFIKRNSQQQHNLCVLLMK